MMRDISYLYSVRRCYFSTLPDRSVYSENQSNHATMMLHHVVAQQSMGLIVCKSSVKAFITSGGSEQDGKLMSVLAASKADGTPDKDTSGNSFVHSGQYLIA